LEVYQTPYRTKNASMTNQMRMIPSNRNKVYMFRLHQPQDWTFNWMLNSAYSVNGLDIVEGPGLQFFQSKDYAFFSPALLDRSTIKEYRFQLLDVVVLQGKQVYVLGFKPASLMKTTYFQGRLYIDVNSLAFVRAEYQLTPGGLHLFNNPTNAYASYFQAPPMKLVRREYMVNYAEYEGYWSFDRGRIENDYVLESMKAPVVSVVDFEVIKRVTGKAGPFRRGPAIRVNYASQPFVYQIPELIQSIRGKANTEVRKTP
jgi:hypothetical protein